MISWEREVIVLDKRHFFSTFRIFRTKIQPFDFPYFSNMLGSRQQVQDFQIRYDPHVDRFVFLALKLLVDML